MIVDDEPFIAQGLQVLINWKRQNFEIVKIAENGQEAFDYLKENKIDLVITDIKMPIMNGVELLQKVKEEKVSDAYFVILSGYNDFKYARDAMRYGCLDYLLKPIKKEELLAILRKVADMNQENVEIEKHQKETESAFFQKHLITLIVGKYDEASLEYVNNNMKLSDGVRYVIIEVPDVDESEVAEGGVLQYRHDMDEASERIMGADKKHLLYDVSLNHGSYDTGFIYCDYMAEEKNMDEMEYFAYLQKNLQEALGREIRIIAGKKVPDISSLSKSYSSACILMSQEVFHESRPVVTYEKEMSVNPGKEMIFKHSIDELIKAIELNDEALIHKSVNSFYDDIGAAGPGNSVSLNINYLLFQLAVVIQHKSYHIRITTFLQRFSLSHIVPFKRLGESHILFQFTYTHVKRLKINVCFVSQVFKDIETVRVDIPEMQPLLVLIAVPDESKKSILRRIAVSAEIQQKRI